METEKNAALRANTLSPKYKHAASKCPPQALVRSFTVLIRKIPLRAENFAAFRAPTLDDIAAICRFHTLTESVHFAPLALLGLIGSKHSNTPRFVVKSCRRVPAKIAHTGSCPHDMNLMYYSRRHKAMSRSFLSFAWRAASCLACYTRNLANTNRPAEVWSALVTTISSVSPIYFRAFSTITIVPSGK